MAGAPGTATASPEDKALIERWRAAGQLYECADELDDLFFCVEYYTWCQANNSTAAGPRRTPCVPAGRDGAASPDLADAL